jgi:hypothetical protein
MLLLSPVVEPVGVFGEEESDDCLCGEGDFDEKDSITAVTSCSPFSDSCVFEEGE